MSPERETPLHTRSFAAKAPRARVRARG